MPAHFALDRFERVDASPTLALLRLSGRWSAEPGPAAELVVGEERYTPLPGPAADLADWRGAYPVPVDVLTAGLEDLALGTGLRLAPPVAPGEPMPPTQEAQVARLSGEVSALEAEAVLLERDRRRTLASHHEMEARAQAATARATAAERRVLELEQRVAELEAAAEEAETAASTELVASAAVPAPIPDESLLLEVRAGRERVTQLETALRGVIAEEERHLAYQAELEQRVEGLERQVAGAPAEHVSFVGEDPYDDRPSSATAAPPAVAPSAPDEELELLRVEVESLRQRAERGEAALLAAADVATADHEDPAVLRTLVEELEHAVQMSSGECADLNDRLARVTQERDAMALRQAAADAERQHATH